MAETTTQRWLAIVLSVAALSLGGHAMWLKLLTGDESVASLAERVAPLVEANEEKASAETPATARLAPDYREILARPLFSPWRAPPEKRMAVAVPEPVKPTAVPVRLPPQLAKGEVQLLGVVIDGGREVVLIRSRRAQGVLRLSVGDLLDGWRVVEIAPESISLEQGGIVEQVSLRDTEATAVPNRRPVQAQQRVAPQPIVRARPPGAKAATDNRLIRFHQTGNGKGRQPLGKAPAN